MWRRSDIGGTAQTSQVLVMNPRRRRFVLCTPPVRLFVGVRKMLVLVLLRQIFELLLLAVLGGRMNGKLATTNPSVTI